MRKRKPALFIISFWIAFYFLNNYIWLKNSAGFPIEPQNAKFYAYMATWTELIRNLDFKMMNLLLIGAGVYPPFSFLPAVFSSLLFGGNYFSHIMLNIAYFALVLVGVYLLAKELYNERCAIISVCLLSLYPAVYGFSRKFFIEFEMMWLVVFAILMLVRSRFFNVRKYSVFLGIFLGLGLMTKGSFPLFVFGPLAYAGFRMVKGAVNINRPAGLDPGRAVFNLFLSLFISLAIAGYRYCRLSLFYHHLVECFAEPSGFTPIFYVKDLFQNEITPVFFILFIISLVHLLIIRRNEKEQKAILLLWFMIPFLYHSLMLHRKEARFILPYLPAVAIISAVWLDSIRRKGLRISLICFLMTAGLLQYYRLSYASGSTSKDIVHRPTGREKKFFDNIIAIVSPHIDTKGKSRVLWFVDSEYQDNFNKHVWSNIVWLGKLPVDLELLNIGDDRTEGFLESFRQADIVVYVGGADLKSKGALDKYIDHLFEGSIDLIRRHPPLAASHSIYIKILKGDYSSLYPEGYLESLKSKAGEVLSSFELVDSEKLDFDVGPNLYIYVRKK